MYVRSLVLWPCISVILLTAVPVYSQVTRSFAEPIERSEVAAAEPGVVVRILVKEGQQVKAGQVLAELDREVLIQSLRLAELEAASRSKIDAAESLLRIRKQRKETLAPLLKSGHANPAELEQANAEFEQALAERNRAVEESEQAAIEVERIKAQLDRRVIHSPLDGVVTEIHRRAGEFIAANDPRFATVVQLDQLRVRFYLNAEIVEDLERLMRVPVQVGTQAKARSGVVEFVSPITDSGSGTVRVDVLLNNEAGQLRAGTPVMWLMTPTSLTSVNTSNSN
ncbi:MAG: efflux RND transporter periplasmic adaptor subunit [Planctomycetales bacterium]|nr:efflux RND transporter periplasmic adaptor subunit [Planctomycetales bacterium]